VDLDRVPHRRTVELYAGEVLEQDVDGSRMPTLPTQLMIVDIALDLVAAG
jgi:hypothetical protein